MGPITRHKIIMRIGSETWRQLAVPLGEVGLVVCGQNATSWEPLLSQRRALLPVFSDRNQ